MSNETKELVFNGGFDRADSTVDGKKVANLVYKDKNAYYDLSGISPDEINRVSDWNQRYSTGAAKYSAEYAADLLASEKDLSSVVVTFPYGRDCKGSVSTNVDRSVRMVNPNTKETFYQPSARVVVTDKYVTATIKSSLSKDIKEMLKKKLG